MLLDWKLKHGIYFWRVRDDLSCIGTLFQLNPCRLQFRVVMKCVN